MAPRTLAIASLLVVGALLAAMPTAHAGAVFEIRERPPASANDILFNFENANPNVPPELGSIVQSNRMGAGNAYNTSIIPLTIVTLNKCVALSPHIHPNGAETVFVLEGEVRVHQVRGEGVDANFAVDVKAGEAAYIQQGSVHLVENINKGTSKFLQLFDHPQAGAVFVAPALVALPRNVVNSAFSKNVLYDGVQGFPLLIKVRECGW